MKSELLLAPAPVAQGAVVGEFVKRIKAASLSVPASVDAYHAGRRLTTKAWSGDWSGNFNNQWNNYVH